MLVALAMVFCYMVVDYSNMMGKAIELKRVQKENITQKIELQELNTKIDDMETYLTKLQVFDKKIRVMANIDNGAGANAATGAQAEPSGMGGTSGAADYFVNPDRTKNRELVSKVYGGLDLLKMEAAKQEKSFTEIQELLLRQSSLLASTPSIWPARGWLTSSYGYRGDPFNGRYQMHSGLDIANRVGSEIIAPADGIVTRATMIPALGKVVEISHGYGVKTVYGHLSELGVTLGQRVKRGQPIAKMGSTGRSTGPHLHYEVLVNGVTVNPSKYILN